MTPEAYIPDPTTSAQHLSNVFFQALNVKGWIGAGQPENAHVKAVCLLDAAEGLVAALEAEMRKEREQSKPEAA